LGKFVPGLSTFVVPVAGLSGMRYPHFFRDDGGGIALWAFLMIAIGYVWGEWIRARVESAEPAKWLLLAAGLPILISYYWIKLWRLKKYDRATIN
jgi:membrane protein DedA with SNARE-associated domain